MSPYAIGIDFGTLSARALLIDASTGEERGTAACPYAHGVMTEQLPSGRRLPPDWALQHPSDYLDSAITVIRTVLAESGVNPAQVVGLGLDFTSCTILPVLQDGTPLCLLPELQDEPHAYVKLWKHHAAQYCADLVNQVAEETQEDWLPLYGGKISCEWMVPKSLQILKEAPEIYRRAHRIIEAGDWMVWQFCGEEKRSVCNAGYKAMWHDGYPNSGYFQMLDPDFEHFATEKLAQTLYPIGERAGFLTKAMAEKTGLTTDTAVAVGIVDAHASVLASGVDREGKMLMIMGTSTCHMLLTKEERGVEGSCGVVKDGMLPGFYGYEAGQTCVGDHFSWFTEQLVSAASVEAANAAGLSLHRYLQQEASRLSPGESGLLALDWWNGVRSPLMDFDLSGMFLGMTLKTKPPELYRALVESTAYGTRAIIDAFEQAGVPVNSLYATGGIPQKSPEIMQIYADICGKEIRIAKSAESGALGSAILGIAAAKEKGGYGGLAEIVARLGCLRQESYQPIPAHVEIYHALYTEYMILQDYFGKGENNVMKRLKKLRAEQIERADSR